MILKATAQADVIAYIESLMNTLLGGSAFIRFWTGSVPPDCETGDSGTQVAACPLSATPLATPVGSVISFNTITDDTATNAGTVTYARVTDGGGTTIVAQFTCGITASGMEIEFDNDVFGVGDTCHVDSLEIDISFT